MLAKVLGFVSFFVAVILTVAVFFVVVVASKSQYLLSPNQTSFRANPKFSTGKAGHKLYREEYSKHFHTALSNSGEWPSKYSGSEYMSDCESCGILNFQCDFGDLKAFVSLNTCLPTGFISDGTVRYTDGQSQWEMDVRRLGGPAEVNTNRLIPESLKKKMELLVAKEEADFRQSSTDLDLLQKLYQSNSDPEIESGIESIGSKLIASLTRQMLESNLFEPNPILKQLTHR